MEMAVKFENGTLKSHHVMLDKFFVFLYKLLNEVMRPCVKTHKNTFLDLVGHHKYWRMNGANINK